MATGAGPNSSTGSSLHAPLGFTCWLLLVPFCCHRLLIHVISSTVDVSGNSGEMGHILYAMGVLCMHSCHVQMAWALVPDLGVVQLGLSKHKLLWGHGS